MDELKQLSQQIKKTLGNKQRKEYLFQIEILEARNLKSPNLKGKISPFVKIIVGNLQPQVTHTKQGSNVVFKQNFTFDCLKMTDNELQNFDVQIFVMNFNEFALNEIIGSYSIGCSTLYNSPNHEIFQSWVQLLHPEHGLEDQGQLQMSCYIIQTGDQPPVHDINEVIDHDEVDLEFDGIPDDQLTLEQQIKKRENKKKLQVIQRPVFLAKGFQLQVNIVKAEDIKIMVSNKVDPFVSVKAGGNIQKTSTILNSQKPSFLQRLFFPIIFPIYNDKIVCRLWDKRTMLSDIFIANIPEIQSENNYFNLNFLQSSGGIMGYKWFNLFGIPNNERPNDWEKLFGKKKSKVGTDYMGRVLISISLTPNQSPKLNIQQLGGYREPPIERYVLRADCYEINGSYDFGKKVLVEIKMGKYVISDQKKLGEQKSQKSKQFTYQWKKVDFADVQCEFPIDNEQHPDIIVSIKNPEKLDQRLSYCRIKAQSEDLQKQQPFWYSLKGKIKYIIYQILPQTSLGVMDSTVINSYILLNLQLIHKSNINNVPRLKVKRGIIQEFVFRVYLYAGYDILVSQDSHSINCVPEFHLGRTTLNIKDKNQIYGKNPIWNQILEDKVELEQKLEFSSGLLIVFKNKHKKLEKNKINTIFNFGGNQEDIIGECSVDVNEMKTDKEFLEENLNNFKPKFQFFHILQNGISQGRILAAFHLFPISKSNRANIEINLKEEHVVKKYMKVNLEIPIIGVRDLAQGMKNPHLIVRLPWMDIENHTQQENQIENIDQLKEHQNLKRYWETIPEKLKFQKENQNFNFCIMISNIISIKNEDNKEEGTLSQKEQQVADNSENILLPQNPIFLPQLEIEIQENGQFSQQTYVSYISLIDYCSWIPRKKKIIQAKLFWEKGKYSYLEKLEQGKQQDKIANFDVDIEEIKQSSINNLKQSESQIFKNSEHILFNKEDEKNILDQEEDEEQKFENNSVININKNDKLKLDIQNLDEAATLKQDFSRGSVLVFKNNEDDDEEEEENQILQDFKIKEKKFKDAKIYSTICFSKTEQDLLIERKERNDKIKEIEKKANYLLKQKVKGWENIKKKLLRQIENIKEQEVSEKEFFGEEEDFNEKFDYGRPVERKPIEDLIISQLPYQKFPLFKISIINEVKGQLMILQLLSEEIQSFLKGNLRLKIRDLDNFSLTKELSQTFREMTIISKKSKKSVFKLNNEEKCGLINYKSELDDPLCPFTIFDPVYLNFFKSDYPLKCRIFVFQCSNLAAQISDVDYLQQMTNVKALSLASSFLELQTGSGDTNKEMIRLIKDNKFICNNTLNPVFFKQFELDSVLPDDWKLEVRVMNKGVLDSLIGSFIIDLEDRILGEKLIRRGIALQIKIREIQNQLDEIKFKKEKKFDQIKKTLPKKLKELQEKYDILSNDIKMPVEFKALKNPKKLTNQGSIQFLLEPFPINIAQEIPLTNYQPEKPEEFEIRLIIWETFKIPLPLNSKLISIKVLVTLDEDATGEGKEITKETDTHNGSETGDGIFNWRMKFPFQMPTKYPRLTIHVYNFSTFGTNELMGQKVISLKKTLRKLKTEGIYEMGSTNYELEHTSFQGQSRGEVQISMKIINKKVADQNLVGEGQEEPNQDPFLKKPTEGRGIGDFLKGGLQINLWGIICKRILKIFAGLAISTLTTFILFVKPGILVNQGGTTSASSSSNTQQ